MRSAETYPLFGWCMSERAAGERARISEPQASVERVCSSVEHRARASSAERGQAKKKSERSRKKFGSPPGTYCA